MTRDEYEREGESETDRAWREIVAHYGERPVLESDTSGSEARAEESDHIDPDVARYDLTPDDVDRDETDDLGFLEDADEPRFRPPPAPPVPRPRTWQRGVAWAGVVFAPLLALTAALTPAKVPGPVGWLVLVWGIAGFVYLAVLAPREPLDPWDDGSRV